MMWLISLFSAALLGWSAILWLILPIDIFKYSLTSIVAMHVAVPAGIISIWALGRGWYRSAQQKKAAAAEASQRDIRNAERARQKHLFDEGLKNRRISIDCRWAVTADVMFQEEAKALTKDTDQTATRFFYTEPSASTAWPQTALVELLDDLFSTMPGAMTLPIAVCGPAHQSGTGNEMLIRQVRQAALARQEEDFSKLVSSDIISVSNDSRGVYTVLHDVFMRRRDWPAIVLIAFDNRFVERPESFDFEISDNPLSEIEKWQGKAGRAISLLLLSQTELTEVLSKLDELGESAVIDNLTPYWEKQKVPAGMAGYVSKWPKIWRDNFAAMQPIATLHRTSFAEVANADPISQRAKNIEAAITDAAINASLSDLDFFFEGESESVETQQSSRVSETGWLFHNAGDISCCGDRMSAMGLAMWQSSIELNPVDQATNTVMAIGDCGVATSYVSMALAVQRIAEIRKPVLRMEFADNELAVDFVAPFQLTASK